MLALLLQSSLTCILMMQKAQWLMADMCTHVMVVCIFALKEVTTSGWPSGQRCHHKFPSTASVLVLSYFSIHCFHRINFQSQENDLICISLHLLNLPGLTHMPFGTHPNLAKVFQCEALPDFNESQIWGTALKTNHNSWSPVFRA